VFLHILHPYKSTGNINGFLSWSWGFWKEGWMTVASKTNRNKYIRIYSSRAGLGAEWSGVRVPAGVGNYSLHHHVQTGSGAHPASYRMGTRGCLPENKSSIA